MSSANLTLTSATAATIVASFVEPTTNVDGTPITNLKQTNVSISFDAGVSYTPIAVDLASNAGGGGSRTKTVLGVVVPTTASSAIVRLVAENTVGFKSDSVDITVSIARPIPNPVG